MPAGFFVQVKVPSKDAANSLESGGSSRRSSSMITRRRLLQTSLGAAASLSAGTYARAASTNAGFSFILLGDLHYDKLEHHDMAWLEKKKGGAGSKVVGKSFRVVAPNLQRIKILLNKTVQRALVCTSCIQANKVTRAA